jgi:hypothetical protein
MLQNAKARPDLLLLLSLLLVILMAPVLDHSDLGRLLLAVLMFVPVLLATVRLSQIRGWVWPSVLLMLGAVISSVLSKFYPSRAMLGTKWSLLAGFFALTVIGLFSYLKNARHITNSHLYTAVSIYVLLGFLWFALYCATDVFYPGSFLQNNTTVIDRASELLYFSLVTLSTIGYGEVVTVHGEARMLAALEGVTGVLYVAITVALLVSSYRSREPGRGP